ATPPLPAKLSRTRVRSRRSSSSVSGRTAMKGISPPLIASKAGGRVRSEVAQSTCRSRPARPPSRSVPAGRAPRQRSITVITGISEPGGRHPDRSSGPLQVLLLLPRSDLSAVLLPLQGLDLEETLRQRVSQSVEHHLVRLEGGDGVLEVVGQEPDVAALQLDIVEAVEGLLDRRRQRQG